MTRFDISLTLDQGQEMTLKLTNYIPLLPQLVALSNKSQTALVSKISIVLAFSHVKAYVFKIDPAAK